MSKQMANDSTWFIFLSAISVSFNITHSVEMKNSAPKLLLLLKLGLQFSSVGKGLVYKE
jgi:hypothetical protein